MFRLNRYKSEETPPPPPTQRVLIIDMPDLVMKKILDEVDLVSIMKLRKVCCAFRNFIDDTKSDSKLKEITIITKSDTIFVSYGYFLSKPLGEETPSKEKTSSSSEIYENFYKWAGSTGNTAETC
ncbi:hypothetical protein GCK72_021454 [Caenorhabditis remanei]|uniref:F-box domain-containing protein n=1 Tax=Caenorhabditis remanei TaxID=31234 RepID=A0A6A5GKM8_CAERE|nr:hypothetical protein GCK72_021454 [Caenorhabditis remanei]KAF1754889.1 hypothetical protein GCK72_021454 [Caenorhabditis remanei]